MCLKPIISKAEKIYPYIFDQELPKKIYQEYHKLLQKILTLMKLEVLKILRIILRIFKDASAKKMMNCLNQFRIQPGLLLSSLS